MKQREPSDEDREYIAKLVAEGLIPEADDLEAVDPNGALSPEERWLRAQEYRLSNAAEAAGFQQFIGEPPGRPN